MPTDDINNEVIQHLSLTSHYVTMITIPLCHTACTSFCTAIVSTKQSSYQSWSVVTAREQINDVK